VANGIAVHEYMEWTARDPELVVGLSHRCARPCEDGGRLELATKLWKDADPTNTAFRSSDFVSSKRAISDR
jgi:hypothetical protein